MPVGEYEIQVGIYDATTQMRHSLVEPGAGTFVVIQKWSIDGAGSRDRQVQALNSKQTGMDCVMGL
jgi:hypothetical protein